jgi:colicin import membrane protein
MQTPKLSLVICALALVSTLTIRAADNAAQAAARTALAAKLFEVGSQTPTNPPAAEAKTVAPKVVTPVVVAPAVADEPVLKPISAEAKAKAKAQAKADKLAAQAKAKAEAKQAAADKKAQKEAAKLAAAKKSADEAAAKMTSKTVAPASVKMEPAPVAKVQPAPKVMAAANGDNPAQAAARAALAQKLFETSQTQSGWEASSKTTPKIAVKEAKPVAKSEPKPNAKPKPAPSSLVKLDAPKASYTSSEPELKKFDAPASPLPASKQQKLQALLAKYKADQIAPAEYFTQRSAILNEP